MSWVERNAQRVVRQHDERADGRRDLSARLAAEAQPARQMHRGRQSTLARPARGTCTASPTPAQLRVSVVGHGTPRGSSRSVTHDSSAASRRGVAAPPRLRSAVWFFPARSMPLLSSSKYSTTAGAPDAGCTKRSTTRATPESAGHARSLSSQFSPNANATGAATHRDKQLIQLSKRSHALDSARRRSRANSCQGPSSRATNCATRHTAIPPSTSDVKVTLLLNADQYRRRWCGIVSGVPVGAPRGRVQRDRERAERLRRGEPA